MAEDWLADVKKYVPNADPAVVAAIVRYCGIALQKRDSSLVSMSDPTETGRVRENFLKKKLALTDSDDVLNAAIASVGERMKADRTKNRVTVYYLLAEHFGKLGLFGGGATAVSGESAGGPSGAGAAALGAAGLAAGAAAIGGSASDSTPPPEKAAVPTPEPAAPASTDSNMGALGAAAAAATGAGSAVSGAANEAASRFADIPDEAAAGSGMGKWWLWLLLALVLIALFFGLRSCMTQQTTVTANTSDSAVSGDLSTTADNETAAIDTNQATAEPGAATPAPSSTAAPAGSGVVAGTRNGLPMLTVYFDTGKADVSKDFATVAGSVKDYVAAHPDAKLAVSGFNDPTGNAATNAALSKRRAQGVAAALEATGVPAAAVALEKPADTTVSGTSNAEARRVEVTVKQ